VVLRLASVFPSTPPPALNASPRNGFVCPSPSPPDYDRSVEARGAMHGSKVTLQLEIGRFRVFIRSAHCQVRTRFPNRTYEQERCNFLKYFIRYQDFVHNVYEIKLTKALSIILVAVQI
jgi:hypothetical protein